MTGRSLMLLLIALLSVLIILPVAVLVLGSFLTEPPRALSIEWSGLTLQNYREIFSDDRFWRLLLNTVGAALIGTAGAVAIGSTLAWLAVRTDVPGWRVLDAVALMPMFVPPLIGAFAWDMLGSPTSGMLNIVLRQLGLPGFVNVYAFSGICFVFAIYYAPYVYLFVAAALRNMDAALEEAAALCGAGRLRTMLQITLPLVSPALLSASLLVFVLLIEIFAIPAVLALPGKIGFMSVRIWELIEFAPPKVNEASALGVVMLVITITLVLFQNRVLARRSFVTVAGKGLHPERHTLGRARWPLALFGFSYLLFIVILPYAALLLVALRRSLFMATVSDIVDPAQLTFDQFDIVLGDPVIQQTLLNSLLVSLGTVLIGGALYFVVSYIVHRTKAWGRRTVDVITVLPVAIPGIIIGLGYLWSWITLSVGIYGTLWIIILAFISQFSPQGVRAISTSLVQIHPELEESSRLCGARFAYTMWRVVLPLARPGIFAAMILLAILSFREVATALFLYTSNTQVFSLAMFDFWLRGSTNLVAVMAIAQTFLLLLLVVLGQRFLLAPGGAPRPPS
jgi:iron(III) transport system permease protein